MAETVYLVVNERITKSIESIAKSLSILVGHEQTIQLKRKDEYIESLQRELRRK